MITIWSTSLISEISFVQIPILSNQSPDPWTDINCNSTHDGTRVCWPAVFSLTGCYSVVVHSRLQVLGSCIVRGIVVGWGKKRDRVGYRYNIKCTSGTNNNNTRQRGRRSLSFPLLLLRCCCCFYRGADVGLNFSLILYRVEYVEGIRALQSWYYYDVDDCNGRVGVRGLNGYALVVVVGFYKLPKYNFTTNS